MTSKWQNVDAGPRQLKDLQKAIRDLNWEGRTYSEVSGTIGGEEHRSSYVNVMGTVRPEVTALDEAIREVYNSEVTKANVRSIIADYEAALPEAKLSRPVDDKRITPEVRAEQDARIAARHAEEQAVSDAHKVIMDAVMAKAPPAAKALIIAEYRKDASDPMSDYSASHTQRAIAIGWRFSSREDFRALAAAAAQFSETTGVTFTEHRDNHSMGHGNYLSDHGWAGSGTGWLIRSYALPARYLQLSEDAIPEQAAATWVCRTANEPASVVTAPEGITITPSSLGRAGVVEVRFSEKPAPEVLSTLKARGFRWARGNRCWYGKQANLPESLAS
jgi:hypothetical protein